MRFRATIAATLLLAASAVFADSPKNWVTNGDFAAGVPAGGDKLCPDGWEFGWKGSESLVVKTVKAPGGGSYVQIRAEHPPAGGAYLVQTIPYDQARAGNGGFEFSCEVKTDNCAQGAKPYMTARALLLYTTADRVLQDHLARKFVGSADWSRVYIPCKLPADTIQMQVLLGFHTSQGTLSVRNVKLIQVDSPRPAENRTPGIVTTTIAPGIVETDYGVTRTLKVGSHVWSELPDGDAAAEWYRMPDPDGAVDPQFVRRPDWTDAERAQGFVVYQDAERMIAPPRNVPRREQIVEGNRPVTTSLCPGETRAAGTVIHPLRDLESVSIRFDQLKSGGDVIGPECLRADHVETMFYRANNFRQYSQMPRAIVRFDTVNLSAGKREQFWIYCTAPDDAPAGVYEGAASILSKGKRIGRIPLRVEVYPFELAPAFAQWSMYFYYPPNEELLREMKYMQWLGMNSVIYSPSAKSMFDRLSLVDGQVRFDFTPDDQFMATYKEAGYKRPIIYYPRLVLLKLVELTCPPGTELPRAAFHTTTIPLIGSEAGYSAAARDGFKQFLKLVVDHAKEANWPEMILYLTDEPAETHWREFETGMSYKLAKEVCPQIKTYCTLYGIPLIEKYGKYIDYISSRGLERAAPRWQNEDFLKACAKTGSRPWAACWPPLFWHNYWYARAYAGFVNVRSGFEGNNIWLFPRVGKDLRYPFKSLRPGGSANGVEVLRRTKDGEHENSTVFEGIREGILDARYIATLQGEIKRAKDAGRDAAAYEKELTGMIESAPELRADSGGACWDRPGLADAGNWSVAKNEQLRQRIAQMIIDLGDR